MTDSNLPSAPQLNVLLVEREPSLASELATQLHHAGARVTVAHDEATAISLLRHETPFDAALLDLDLDDLSVEPLLRALRTRPRPCLPIALSRVANPAAVRSWIMVGAFEVAFVPIDVERLVAAVRRTAEATHTLWSRLASEPAPRPARVPPHTPCPGHASSRVPTPGDLDDAVSSLSVSHALSQRETAVLRYIALGYRYRDIGLELSISPRTVKMHAANLRRKTGVHNRYDLIRKMFHT